MCSINCSGGCIECAPEEHCSNYKTNGCPIEESKAFDWDVCPCARLETSGNAVDLLSPPGPRD
jgi:hypothetical protein